MYNFVWPTVLLFLLLTGTPARRPLRSSCSSVPRRVFTKLTLSKTKKQKEESVQLHNPDTVLNKLANPGLFEATNTTEPFTMSSVYFDEEWMVQQEKEFTKWLNSLLTPPEELSSTTALPKGCKNNIQQEQYSSLLPKYETYHMQGCTNCPQNWEPSHNFRCQVT
jgi:hypothetical protein